MQQTFFIADIACSTCFRHYYVHNQELENFIQMAAACGIWCFGFQVVGMVWSWAPNTTGSNHLYNTLELLMMNITVPEIWWASNKICNKKHLLHLVDILFPHINADARSKSLKIFQRYLPKTFTVNLLFYFNIFS
jgi:hypothetical protein